VSPNHLVWALLALLSGGCGGARAATTASPPGLALGAYVDAVREDDAATVHDLLSEQLRAEVTVESLGRLMSENREELVAQANEIETEAVQAVAEQPLIGGERVRMVLEDGRWVIDGGVVSAPGLRSPMATIRAFRRALQRQSLPGTLRVLSRQPRAELEAEVARILEETGDELDLEVEIRGNRARVRTTGGREITMVREAGEWRIVAID
jgi:hypothetical protein